MNDAYLTPAQRFLLRRFMNHVGCDEEAAISSALGEIDRLRVENVALRGALTRSLGVAAAPHGGWVPPPADTPPYPHEEAGHDE